MNEYPEIQNGEGSQRVWGAGKESVGQKSPLGSRGKAMAGVSLQQAKAFL